VDTVLIFEFNDWHDKAEHIIVCKHKSMHMHMLLEKIIETYL